MPGVILTPDQRLRVFISSTLDLTAARAAAKRSIESLGLTPVMFEAGARPHPPRALYRAYLEQSDVFIAVYSRRYGWTAPDMSISGLEDEFDLSAGKPRLVYIEADVEREPAMAAFLTKVQSAGLSYRHFRTPEELADLVRGDLVMLLTEQFHAARTAPRRGTGTTTAPGQRTRAERPAALPVPLTALIGREAEVGEVAATLSGGTVRLLTLTGPGGVGKTRLAVEAARRLTPDFPGGVFFVPLATVREPGLLGEAIATALGVAPGEAGSGVLAVRSVLSDRPALLVLDNLEQVVEGAPVIGELLGAAPQLSVLATSRAPLRLRGEREVEVLPLAVQPAGALPDAAFPAVQLFVERAQAVRADVTAGDATAADVAEICRLLDGLPLAIELAAAMTRVLPVSSLLERLRGGPSRLSGGLRDVPERHRGLADTIAWSYDLLEEPSRALFAQLSVFRGGFSLETAERVCQVDGDLLAGVAALTEQSLVRARVAERAGPRFAMLGTIRYFAAERLAESPQGESVLARHAEVFLELAERVGGSGGHDPAVLDAVELELDNVRRAFEWCQERGEADRLAEAVWRSWWFWWSRGFPKEGRLWADRCLAAPSLSPGARGRALTTRALLAIWSGEYALAVAAFDEAAPLVAATGDALTAAYIEVGRGLVVGVTRSVPGGAAVIRRAVAAFEGLGDGAGATVALAAASWLHGITRDFDGAEELLTQAAARASHAGSPLEAGLVEAAVAQYRMTRGDEQGAYEAVAHSLEDFASTRHVGSLILTLEIVAELALDAGRPAQAVVLLGATAAIRQGMGTRVPPQAAARLTTLLDTARDRLPEEFDDLVTDGARLTLPAAVERGRVLIAELRGDRADARSE